jgi:hypothetical protein
VSWLIKLAAYYRQSLLITGRVYCPMIKLDWLPAGVLLSDSAHCLQILPANEKLGLEAEEISQTQLSNRMQRKTTGLLNKGTPPELIFQDCLAGCWCTPDLGWPNIGLLQVQAGVPQAKHKRLYSLQALRRLDINTDQYGATLN